MGPASIKIILVDDRETVLKGLRMRLVLENDLEIVGEARDGLAAIELVQQVRPDIVVMDIEMRNMDGITATRAITELFPEVIVIMLSIHDDPQLRAKARQAGATAYVEKRDGAARLVSEIRAAYKNKKKGTQV